MCLYMARLLHRISPAVYRTSIYVDLVPEYSQGVTSLERIVDRKLEFRQALGTMQRLGMDCATASH